MFKAIPLALALLLAGCESDAQTADRRCANSFSYVSPGVDSNEPCRARVFEELQRSRDEQNAILGGIIAGGGYHPYRPAPTLVTCAPGAQGTVSCIGQ